MNRSSKNYTGGNSNFLESPASNASGSSNGSPVGGDGRQPTYKRRPPPLQLRAVVTRPAEGSTPSPVPRKRKALSPPPASASQSKRGRTAAAEDPPSTGRLPAPNTRRRSTAPPPTATTPRAQRITIRERRKLPEAKEKEQRPARN